MTVELARANPLRYVGIFFVANMISIYFGVSLSAMAWDVLHHDPAAVLVQDPDLITRWIGFSLCDYGMPILVVLLLRYLGWTVDASQPNSYLISYASIFLIALAVSALFLAFAIWMAGASPTALRPFPQLVGASLKWSISPAIVAVYVAYHVDRQIDPLLPDIGSYRYWGMSQRLMSCVFFSLLVTVFSALPALSISSSASPIWPVNKLRLVVLGTTFFIGVIMAIVGEFFLVKPKPASDR
jgi:hypothetical protein